MMKKTHLLFCAITISFLAACEPSPNVGSPITEQIFPQGETSDFVFETSGLKLSGILDAPKDGDAKALILLVHGYGETNIRERNSFSELRQRFNAIGIATAVWDKPGQGQSEGTFDINQSVYSSAREVIDAAEYFRKMNAPGSDKIGIWGVSRAGWIAPLAISQDPDIDFWISVSGTTAEDNFAYLLLSNLPYEGGTHEQALQLASEWRRGCEIFRTGESYDRYLDATQALHANQYILRMRGDWPTRAEYEAQQQACAGGSCPSVDDELCSYVFIEDFDTMLGSLDVDVLAIFGEKDLNIDWRKTSEFYETTIGQNDEASLAIEVFNDADHNLNISETGSIREMRSMTAPQKSDGYYDAQVVWLQRYVVGSSEDE